MRRAGSPSNAQRWACSAWRAGEAALGESKGLLGWAWRKGPQRLRSKWAPETGWAKLARDSRHEEAANAIESMAFAAREAAELRSMLKPEKTDGNAAQEAMNGREALRWGNIKNGGGRPPFYWLRGQDLNL